MSTLLLLLCYLILEQYQEYRQLPYMLYVLCRASPIFEEVWFQKCKLFQELG